MGLLDPPALTLAKADARYATLSPSTIRKFQVALAKRQSQRVDVLALGDSFFEGTGATAISTRWQAILQQRLRALFQPAGVTGAAVPYIHPWSSTGLTLPVTTTGTTSQSGWGGLGLKVGSISAAGGSYTFTFTGTSAALRYPKGTLGKLAISVDSGTATVVDQFASGGSGGFSFATGALTAGSHTVAVSRDASSVAGRACAIEGLVTYNGDETTGIRIIDAAHHGIDTSGYLDSFNLTYWPGSYAAAAPYAMILLGLGLNDATVPRIAADYKANMQAIITKLRTAPISHTGTIGLVYWPLRSNTDATLYAAYKVALIEIAAADPDIVFIPIDDKMPAEGTAYNDPTNLGLYNNTDHPNDFGHSYVGDLFGSVLTPR